jgi:hypothetical protein
VPVRRRLRWQSRLEHRVQYEREWCADDRGDRGQDIRHASLAVRCRHRQGRDRQWGDRHVDRYSLAKFLRCWLLRQIYEQRSAIDEVRMERSSAGQSADGAELRRA